MIFSFSLSVAFFSMCDYLRFAKDRMTNYSSYWYWNSYRSRRSQRQQWAEQEWCRQLSMIVMTRKSSRPLAPIASGQTGFYVSVSSLHPCFVITFKWRMKRQKRETVHMSHAQLVGLSRVCVCVCMQMYRFVICSSVHREQSKQIEKERSSMNKYARPREWERESDSSLSVGSFRNGHRLLSANKPVVWSEMNEITRHALDRRNPIAPNKSIEWSLISFILSTEHEYVRARPDDHRAVRSVKRNPLGTLHKWWTGKSPLLFLLLLINRIRQKIIGSEGA